MRAKLSGQHFSFPALLPSTKSAPKAPSNNNYNSGNSTYNAAQPSGGISMDTLFKNSSRFSSLSLKDLLEARDMFHYHLMNKKNVVATAVGLYRMRKIDPPDQYPKPTPKAPRRTLFNSAIRPNSWPCV